MPLGLIAYQLWVVFLTSWWLAAFWVSRDKTRAGRGELAAYNLAWGVGFGLLFSVWATVLGRAHLPAALTPLWTTPASLAAILLAAQLGAFAFAWWARVHMGRLWSGAIVVRDDHRVVDTGPFSLVRHPIYSGFILASWPLALIVPAPTALAGAAWLTGVMIVKSRAEERFLRQALGAEAYDAYAARTPQLVPIVGWR